MLTIGIYESHQQLLSTRTQKALYIHLLSPRLELQLFLVYRPSAGWSSSADKTLMFALRF